MFSFIILIYLLEKLLSFHVSYVLVKYTNPVTPISLQIFMIFVLFCCLNFLILLVLPLCAWV